MGVKTVSLKTFRAFLKSKGLILVRTKSSHEIYDYPENHTNRLLRPVTVDKNYPDVPITHIHTNLKTLGVTKKEFSDFVKGF